MIAISESRVAERGVRRAAWALAAALLAALPGAAQAAEPAERVALVIGNSAYHDPDAKLRNPGNDAAGMAAALGRLGFTVRHLEDAGYVDMLRSLLEFSHAAWSAQNAVVYYAGHGITRGARNFLIPVDAGEGTVRGDLDPDELIPVTFLMDSVGGASNLSLVILDATVGAPPEPAEGTIMVLSATVEQIPMDGSGDLSPFTEALLRHLEVPGLELGMLFRRVRADVMRATSGGQTPVVYGLPARDVFLFLGSMAGQSLP